jgi:hypothetical protein
LEYVLQEAPLLVKPTDMVTKTERYVALWQQRGGLPTGPPSDRSDEEGRKAYTFLVERRRDFPKGDAQVYAILSDAYPNWNLTRKRRLTQQGETPVHTSFV